MLNVITAKFCSGSTQTWTEEAYQWDYGQVLQFEGLELPNAYQVHFSNTPLTGETITQIGGADGVTVPDQYFTGGETIYAWVYLHEGEDDGETVYMVTIPVKKRPQPSDDVPTPVEQSAIDQAIAALNIAVENAEDAIEHYPRIQDGTWWVWDVTTETWVDTGVEAQGQPGDPGQDGQDGFSPVITVTDITGGHRVTITDATGTQTFDVMNGQNGQPGTPGTDGTDGYSPTVTVTEITGGHRVTITDAQGAHSFDVMDGQGGSVTVDDELSTTSENPVQNKVITEELNSTKADLSQFPPIKDSDATGVDLDVSDEDGNVLVRFKDGYIKTKNFDSENPDIGIKSSNREGVDLDLSDPNGNIVARFKGGNFITKNFNSETFADVKAFGAIGDGTTDDTEALEAAMEFGFENKKAVRFTEGTYLIRRPLTLRSNMEILGEGNAVIKTKASTTTTLVAALAENSETMAVASVAGFEVGDAIGISYTSTDLAAARHCSVGTITAINSANNTITFKSAYDSIKKGAVRTHEVGCYVSNCCAIFRSYGMLYACDNVYIHGLTLDGNRQSNEWSDWFAGAIHIDAGAGSGTVEGIPYIYSQTNPIFRDLVIKNAHFDGISDQGGGGATITNCVIQNPSMHGVHFGTTYVHATVSDCIIENTQGGAAVFWCADASEIAVIGNKIRNCYKGCSDKEYANAAQKSVIIGNIFENITSYVFDFSATVSSIVGSITIVGNVIIGVKATIANIIHRGRIVFSNNIIDSFTTEPSVLFACDQSERLSIIGNIAPVFSGTVMSGTYTDVVNQLNSWD